MCTLILKNYDADVWSKPSLPTIKNCLPGLQMLKKGWQSHLNLSLRAAASAIEITANMCWEVLPCMVLHPLNILNHEVRSVSAQKSAVSSQQASPTLP